MAATLVGGIRDRQLNNYLYVGEAGLPNIQAAVDYAYNRGGYWSVVIPHGYTDTDLISSVNTHGYGLTVLRDERDSVIQLYYPVGTQFSPYAFEQLAGFIAQGRPPDTQAASMIGYDPTGTNGVGTGNFRVASNPGKGFPAWQVILEPQDGTALWTALRIAANPEGTPRLQIPSVIEIYPGTPRFPDQYQFWVGTMPDLGPPNQPTYPPGQGMYIWAKPAENSVVLQGATISSNVVTANDQALRLNPLGGALQLGQWGALDVNGNLSIQGNIISQHRIRAYGWSGGPPDISASNAGFGTGSDGVTAVLSLINSTAPADTHIWSQTVRPSQMKWSAVADNGIDNYWMWADRVGVNVTLLTVVPNVNIQGNITANDASFASCLVNGSPVVTQEQIPPGGFVYPPAGIAVSDGAAWTVSIDPATVARTNAANTFTNTQVIQGDVFAANGHFTPNDGASGLNAGSYGIAIGWNVAGHNESDFVNANNGGTGLQFGGGFNWYNEPPNTTVTSSTPPLMNLDSGGTLHVYGTSASTLGGTAMSLSSGAITVGTKIGSPFGTDAEFRVDNSGPSTFIDSWGLLYINNRDKSGMNVYGTATVWGTGSPLFQIFNDSFSAAWGAIALGQSGNVTNPLQMVIGLDPTKGANGSGFIGVAKNNVAWTDLWLCQNGGAVNTGSHIVSHGAIRALSFAGVDNTASCLQIGMDSDYTSPKISWMRNGSFCIDAVKWDTYLNFRCVDGYDNAQFDILRLHTDQNVTEVVGTLQAAGNLQVGLASGASAIHPAVLSDGSNLFCNSNPGGAVYINWDRGDNGVKFCDGAEHVVALVDKGGTVRSFQAAVGEFAGGNDRHMIMAHSNSDPNGQQSGSIMVVQENVGYYDLLVQPYGGNVYLGVAYDRVTTVGTVTVGNFAVKGTKGFVTTYPLDRSKDLIHCCLEGPENGVYYRGESETVDGYAVITLPAYFEGLTRQEDRSVQLTIIADGDDPVFALLAAGPVRDGKFTVHSNKSAVKFYWEVKAVRRDLAPLEVVIEREAA